MRVTLTSGLACGLLFGACGSSATTDNSTGAAGTSGAAGTTGAAGTIGAAGTTGVAGSGGSTTCTVTAQTTMSTAIPTVAIVTWSTNLANVTSAEIRFGIAGAEPTMVAPVDLTQANYRTVLLGMKGSRDYMYRIVASAGGASCTSQDYMLRTGPVPTSVPRPTRTVMMGAARARGFIVTSGGTGGNEPAYILDTDGEPVWWAAAPGGTSRAHMSWDGKEMWMLELNVDNGGGEVRRISMDGMTNQNNISGLASAHHDFTVLPDGSIATFLWTSTGMNASNSLIERRPDGTMVTVVANVSTLYNSPAGYHPNAIHYHQSDDSYTIADRNPNLFVKVTRAGALVWQLGGSNPRGQAFTVSGGAWVVNHGHHVLPSGNFLFFNNGQMTGATSQALEYRLDTTAWTATRVWSYQASGFNSPVLGDVQRLPNGNTLVTYSQNGNMHEVSSTGQLVMSLKASSFGYADFRESLYGPPPR